MFAPHGRHASARVTWQAVLHVEWRDALRGALQLRPQFSNISMYILFLPRPALPVAPPSADAAPAAMPSLRSVGQVSRFLTKTRHAIEEEDETDVDAAIARNLWKNHRLLPPTSKFKSNWDIVMVRAPLPGCRSRVGV